MILGIAHPTNILSLIMPTYLQSTENINNLFWQLNRKLCYPTEAKPINKNFSKINNPNKNHDILERFTKILS